MPRTVYDFRIAVDEADLTDLRSRLARARFPARETVPDWSQGAPLDLITRLCDHWRDGYDWRSTQARVNRIPQVLTTIDGVDIHALHVRSRHVEATPLLLTHGWPGSFFEFEDCIEALVDPTAHGGDPADACHVVLPSLPGYGFSGKPEEPGWGIHRIARAWVELMSRLGYERFVAGGSDWGTSVSTSIALQHPTLLRALILVPPLVPAIEHDETDSEAHARAALSEREQDGSAYLEVHRTRPQTIGYALDDSPGGLCAWIAEKVWSWADHDGDLEAIISRDRLLDDISLYWFTRSAASSARLYWESIDEVSGWFGDQLGDPIAVPTAGIVFPAEVPRPSRRWAQRRFTDIVHWGEPDRGGHFGAWEQPDAFVAHVRAALQAVRDREVRPVGC